MHTWIVEGLGRTGVGHRGVVEDGINIDLYAIDAVGFAIGHPQLHHISTADIRCEPGVEGVGIADIGAATRRCRENRPAELQAVAVHIGGSISTQADGIAQICHLIAAGIGHRCGIAHVDPDGIAVTEFTIGYCQLQFIIAFLFDGKAGHAAGGVVQCRKGPRGHIVGEGPLIAEAVAIEIAGLGAVQGNGIPNLLAADIIAGVRHRGDVVGGDLYLIPSAIGITVVHREADGIGARQIQPG